LAKISSLNNTERDPIDMGLGYNGFIITRTANESSNLPEEIEINSDIILVNYGNNKLSKYIDPAHSLEKLASEPDRNTWIQDWSLYLLIECLLVIRNTSTRQNACFVDVTMLLPFSSSKSNEAKLS
jgi:hypothetical protein